MAVEVVGVGGVGVEGVGVEGVGVEGVGVVLESETEELTVAESLSCTRGFLINLSALAVAAKVNLGSGILRFLTPGLAGPTRAGRLAGKERLSAFSSQKIHGS